MKGVRREVEPGLWVDDRRAVFVEEAGALVVADLHFGYEVSQRAAGWLLPVWGREVAVERLEGLLEDWSPDRLVLLGDLVHGRAGWLSLVGWLRGVRVEVVLVRGNHDRGAPKEVRLVEEWRGGG
ncbi:MAG: metallophosphoesterase, partial [Verrucomicrobiia bacterium]